VTAAGLARTGTKVAAMRRCVPAMLALLALAGCGQSDDRATVRLTTQRFLSAVEAKQGAVACGVLTSDTRKALESEESKPCPQAIGSVGVSPPRCSTSRSRSRREGRSRGRRERLPQRGEAGLADLRARLPRERGADPHPLRLRAGGLNVLFRWYVLVIFVLLVLFLVIGFLGL
jgi:hypothetical protein